MQVTATTKYGGSAKENRDGFALELMADLNDAQMAAMAAIGLASLGYRGGAGAVNKALKVESNSETEFSDESATAIETALAEYAKGGAGFSKKPSEGEPNPLSEGFELVVSATRHEHGSAAGSDPGVMAKNFWEQVKATGGFGLLGAGVDANTSDEDGITAARKFLGGIRPPRKPKNGKAEEASAEPTAS